MIPAAFEVVGGDRVLRIEPVGAGFARIEIHDHEHRHTASIVVDLDDLLCQTVRMAQGVLGSEECDAAAAALRCDR